MFAATFLFFPQQTILNLLVHKRHFKNPLGDARKSILTFTKQTETLVFKLFQYI